MALKDTYVPVHVRVIQARTEHKVNLNLKTEVTLLPTEKTADGTSVRSALLKATVLLSNQEIASGHALCTDIDDDKAIEKAESVAVGRALAFAGYSADSGIASAEEIEDFEAKGGSTGQAAAATAPKATSATNQFLKPKTSFGRK